MPEHLGDARAQPPGRRAGVEFGLDDDTALGQVQAAGDLSSVETSALRQQGLITCTRLSSRPSPRWSWPCGLTPHAVIWADPRDPPLLGGTVPPRPRPSAPWRNICAYIPDSSLGSCLGVPSAAATSAITASALSTGSGRARSPASTLIWGTPTPCRPSRRTSFPSLGDTIVSSPFVPAGSGRGPRINLEFV